MSAVPRDELAMMFLKCGVMMANQIPLVTALHHVRHESSSDRLRSALDAVIADVSSGHPLATAMESQPDVFEPAILKLVRAAEETGSVDLIFRNLAEYTCYASLDRWWVR